LEAAGLAAAGATTGAGAGAATTAGAGDSFFATFFTLTDLIAELIVLVPVEVFIVFKRTDYYSRNNLVSNFCQIPQSETPIPAKSSFFY
jgi:hypothetical protein